jgi:PAS domain S-box-containing protein
MNKAARQANRAKSPSTQTSPGMIRALHASERHFRAMFELSSVGMAQLDPATGQLLRVNRRLRDMTGFDAVELGARTIFDLTHPDDLARNHRDFDEMVAGGPSEISMEKRLIRKDGTPIWVLANKCVIRDATGRPELVQEVVTDITARKEAEKLSREREHALREFIKAIPAALYTTDADGVITQFNQAAVELSGRTPKIGVDKWCVTWKLFWPDGTPLPHDECPMAIALKENRPVRGVEALAERPDGSRVPFIPYPTPLRDAQGNLVGAINMLVDISERKADEDALRRSEQFLRLLVDAIPAAVTYVDRDSTFRFSNHRMSEWFGPDREAITDRKVRDVARSEGYAAICEKIETALAGTAVQYETEIPQGTGGMRAVDVRYVPDIRADGRLDGCVGLIHDVTSSKLIETALRQANADLEEFAYAASHDLQEPLRKIHTFADLLQESLREKLDGESRDWLDRLRNAVTRMATLIRNTLELSRASKVGPELKEKVNLGTVLQGAEKELEGAIHQSHAMIKGGNLPSVVGAPAQIQQVFTNLLANSIKYRREDVPLVIEISATRTGRLVEVTLRDNGIGFDNRYNEQIFGLFQRLHSPEKYPGTGIGLAVCRKIIEGHGGTIRADGNAGEGATFRFTLPAASAS